MLGKSVFDTVFFSIIKVILCVCRCSKAKIKLWFFPLNQGQGSVFTVRECAQSIPRLEKSKNRRFSHKNPKMFDFRFNTPTIFPESGSRKHFHASGVRAIDFSHFLPLEPPFQKKFFFEFLQK